MRRIALTKATPPITSIPIGGERSRNAVWTYENPHAAVAEIKGHLAFDPDRVDRIEEL